MQYRDVMWVREKHLRNTLCGQKALPQTGREANTHLQLK